MPDQDSALPAEDSLHRQQEIADLERQVAEAQAELEQYQGLLNDLPGIYEDKFRQKVRSVAEDIRHLLDERKALQEQVSRALAQPRAPEALPPVAADAPPPAPRRWADVRLPSFKSPSGDSPSQRRAPLKPLAFRFGIPKGRQRGVVLGAGLVLALLVLGLPQLLSRRSVLVVARTPAPPVGERPAAAIPASLRLQARGGQSWVRVERLEGGKVLDAILEPGQSKELALGSGLKIRSGRPDLLYVAVGTVRPQPLGGVSDLDWYEFRP